MQPHLAKGALYIRKTALATWGNRLMTSKCSTKKDWYDRGGLTVGCDRYTLHSQLRVDEAGKIDFFEINYIIQAHNIYPVEFIVQQNFWPSSEAQSAQSYNLVHALLGAK